MLQLIVYNNILAIMRLEAKQLRMAMFFRKSILSFLLLATLLTSCGSMTFKCAIAKNESVTFYLHENPQTTEEFYKAKIYTTYSAFEKDLDYYFEATIDDIDNNNAPAPLDISSYNVNYFEVYDLVYATVNLKGQGFSYGQYPIEYQINDNVMDVLLITTMNYGFFPITICSFFISIKKDNLSNKIEKIYFWENNEKMRTWWVVSYEE